MKPLVSSKQQAEKMPETRDGGVDLVMGYGSQNELRNEENHYG
jgi:hypothetical protein